MHAVVRRMPAERARHAKRLGHVQSGPVFQVLASSNSDSSTATTTTAQQSVTSSHTALTTTSTNQSLSSAPPSSSVTQSSSSAPSGATTASTQSTTGAHSLTTNAASTTLIPQPTTLTSIAPTPSTPAPQTNAAASGLSGGAIAGIIAGGAIVGVALIVFFVRKTYLRRRGRQRISWGGAPGLGASVLDEPKFFPDISERPTPSTGANTPQRSAPPSPFEPRSQSMYSAPGSPGVNVQPPTFPTYAVPTPPSATYNNPTLVAPYPTQAAPSMYGPGHTATLAMTRVPPGMGISSDLPSVRAQYAPMEAAVKFSFVPTLPDELSITTGERIFIIEQYDDGWDLCANGRGERGMVPRECLESTPSDQLDIGWRNVQRMSSLNPDGRRY